MTSVFDPYDRTAEQEALKRRAKRAELAAATEAADWAWFLRDPRGVRIARRLLELSGVFRSSFTGNSETFFREGERNVGLRLLATVTQHAPEQLVHLMTEQQPDE